MSNKANNRLSFYFRRKTNNIIDKKHSEKTVDVTEPFKELKIHLNRVDAVPKSTSNFIEETPKLKPYIKNKVYQAGSVKLQENNKTVRRSARNLPDQVKANIPKRQRELDICELPEINFKGKIKYSEDFYTCAFNCDEILQDIKKSECETIPIGFDLEWPFSFQTGSGKTALAQICTSENICYLLHLFNIKKLPAAFVILLSHPKVKLVGVNIKNDIWKLARDFPEVPASEIVANNCIDCGVYLNSVLNRTGRWSLERLTAHLLQKKVDKNPSVRRSKWHILPLSNEQKRYAATDAYVSWLLHITIIKKAEEVAKEEEEKERRRNRQLETGEITEPDLFAFV